MAILPLPPALTASGRRRRPLRPSPLNAAPRVARRSELTAPLHPTRSDRYNTHSTPLRRGHVMLPGAAQCNRDYAPWLLHEA